MSTFQRNAIISGYINSYCLVCDYFFETEHEIFSHVNSCDHNEMLLGSPYLEKYGNNGIRKVKAGYFCEYCNQVMATGAKVSLHVAEKLHLNNKGSMLFKQSGSSIAYGNVLLTESAWHSIQDDECSICDSEFDERTEHIMERSHILKLLQSQVEFDGNNVYRKIDKNNIQCLTCNIKLLENSLKEHFVSQEHMQKYRECEEEKKKYDLENPPAKVTGIESKVETITKEIDKIEVSEDKKELLDSIKENLSGITAVTIPINNKPEVKNKNKTEINAKFVAKEDSKDPATYLKTYAKDNQLIYNAKHQNAFCKICESKFPSTLHSMKEHIKGKDHMHKVSKTAKTTEAKCTKVVKTPITELNKILKETEAKRTILLKTPLADFIHTVHLVSNALGNDTVINDAFCVSQKSCHLLTNIPHRFGEVMCQICNVILNRQDIDEHCRTVKHEDGMRRTPIIRNSVVKDEFIREVRPETFHCGFCNLIIASWDATEAHLKTTEHKNSAGACQRRLQMLLPAIHARKNDNIIKDLFELFVTHMRNN